MSDRQSGAYTISDDSSRIDLQAVHACLERAYWSVGIPFEIVARAVRNSLCIGAYDAAGAQVGLVRLVSDYATFAHPERHLERHDPDIYRARAAGEP